MLWFLAPCAIWWRLQAYTNINDNEDKTNGAEKKSIRKRKSLILLWKRMGNPMTNDDELEFTWNKMSHFRNFRTKRNGMKQNLRAIHCMADHSLAKAYELFKKKKKRESLIWALVWRQNTDYTSQYKCCFCSLVGSFIACILGVAKTWKVNKSRFKMCW